MLPKNILLCNCFKFVASKICSVLVLGKIPCSSSLHRILFSFISVLMSSSILCILLSFLPLPLFSLSFMLLSYIWISSFFFRSFFKNRLPCVSFITRLFHNDPVLQPPRIFSNGVPPFELIKVPRPGIPKYFMLHDMHFRCA